MNPTDARNDDGDFAPECDYDDDWKQISPACGHVSHPDEISDDGYCVNCEPQCESTHQRFS